MILCECGYEAKSIESGMAHSYETGHELSAQTTEPGVTVTISAVADDEDEWDDDDE